MKHVPKKVFVAVSGGVDSAVSLALLKKQGYDVVGCFMKNWSRDFPGLQCNWAGDREDAIRVCASIGVPFRTVDLEKEYRKRVFAYFINEYKRGRTPNPDVLCNSEIKFKAFLRWARRNGADMIATGHYARIRGKSEIQSATWRTKSKTNQKYKIQNFKLLQAVDKNKDQSYFLYRLGQKELRYALFPVGGYTKPEVRKLAQRFGLPVAAKPDSQGVCFVGEVALREFLRNWIPEKEGPIVFLPTKNYSQILENLRMDPATRIGTHPGAHYFTIGQRHGLGLPGGADKPLYVVAKDIKKNILYVGQKDHPLLYKKELTLQDAHWVAGAPPWNYRRTFRAKGGKVLRTFHCKARIRYRQPLENGRVMKRESRITEKKKTVIRNSKFVIRFARPQWAPAPGQSVVLYKNGETPGGGVIAAVQP